MLFILMIFGACKTATATGGGSLAWPLFIFLSSFLQVALAAFERETRRLVFFQKCDDNVFENNRRGCIRPNALHRLFQ